jgi:group I intron endonuclease
MIGIYKITSPSGKVYIGQSWDIDKRWVDYKKYNCKAQTILYNSLRKYKCSAHSFETLQELPSDATQENLNHYENYYIDHYKQRGVELMNIRAAGSNGKLAKETIDKIVAARKANGSYEVKPHVREMRRERQKGKPLPITREHILQTAEKLRGRKHPEWRNEINRQSQLGRKHSEETKRKIAESAFARHEKIRELKKSSHQTAC